MPLILILMRLINDLAFPLDNYTTWPASSVTFEPTFSNLAPFPGITFNASNEQLNLDPTTGNLDYLSFTSGRYSLTTNTISRRNGQKIAEVYRDVSVEIVDCPALPPPFNTIINQPPSVTITHNGKTLFDTSLTITVLAGEHVQFGISASDPDVLPGFLPQSVELIPSGQQFGTNFSDSTNGCLLGACATLNTSVSSYSSTTNTWKAVSQLQTDFSWRTEAKHGSAAGVVHLFYFKINDDYCPIPGKNYVTVAVKVITSPGPLLKGRCLKM